MLAAIELPAESPKPDRPQWRIQLKHIPSGVTPIQNLGPSGWELVVQLTFIILYDHTLITKMYWQMA